MTLDLVRLLGLTNIPGLNKVIFKYIVGKKISLNHSIFIRKIPNKTIIVEDVYAYKFEF